MNCWAAGHDNTCGLPDETVRLTDATASLPCERAGMTLLRSCPPGDGVPRERSGMKVLRNVRVHEACPGECPPQKPTQPRMLDRAAQRLN